MAIGLNLKANKESRWDDPGVAHVSVDVEGSEPTRVRVGGQAVILFKSEIVI